jgi:flagellar biosynthesis/type III secretory pathway protein FliH
MNPFGLTITAVRGELPVGGIVPAATLDEYIDAAAVLRRNRSRAAAVLLASRRCRAQARLEAAQILAEARAEGERRAEAAARAAHDAICEDVLRWLVRESELEAVIAERLELRCRTVIADAVACFAGEAERSALIAQRVAARWREVSSHGAFTLRLCPDDVTAVAARLPAEPGFTISAEPALAAGQALIDSPYVHLRIDLDRHLAVLLAAIGVEPSAASPSAAEPDAAEGSRREQDPDAMKGSCREQDPDAMKGSRREQDPDALANHLDGLIADLDDMARGQYSPPRRDPGLPDTDSAGWPA